MKYFMGIDIGTSSAKSLILAENGDILGVCSCSYGVSRPEPGWAEQDMEEIWKAVCRTIRSLLAQHPQANENLAGVSFSGQMHGLVMLDSFLRPLRPMINWQDQRSVCQVTEILEKIGPENFGRITLNSLSTGFLISSLLWVRENEPRIFEACRHILLPKDYIRFKVCGEIGTDFSDASASLVFDTAGRDWAWDIIDRLNLPRELFPVLRESYELAGYVTNQCADITGLKRGIPVAYGGGDTLMHEVGTGLIRQESAWVSNIGTSCQVSCAVSAPKYDPLLSANMFCHAQKDVWMLMSASLCGGAAMKWVKDNLFPDISGFEEMNEIAQTVPPGCDGLIVVPYLNGSRSPVNNPRARAVFSGVSMMHAKKHFVRAVMEGVIYSLMHNFETVRSISCSDSQTIIASGGGAKGNLLLQMQADAFDRPVYTTAESEQSCIGAAITSALCAGEFSSYDDACHALVRLNDWVIEPIPRNTKIYRENFALYKKICSRNLPEPE